MFQDCGPHLGTGGRVALRTFQKRAQEGDSSRCHILCLALPGKSFVSLPLHNTTWALALPGGMLMLVRHRPLLILGCEYLSLTFHAISPCFSPFSVPLSLSRTFVVSRTEVLAAGSPGNSACFLFVTPLLTYLDPGKPGHQGCPLCFHNAVPVSCQP